MALTNNQTVLDWIDEMAAMTQPEHIVWIDGSDAQMEELRAQACATGELEKLNQEKLDRKSTRLNSSHVKRSRMPSSA